MALAAAAAAAAAARRFGSPGGLTKMASFFGIRRQGGTAMTDSAPSKEELEQFVKDVGSFLRRAQSMPQDQFGSLLKDLSSSMSNLALNKGVLYPTELSNLVATFVPVQGTYVPHNSKVVVVDLVKRMDKIERSSIWKKTANAAVLTTFVGGIIYWPSIVNDLGQEDKREAELITGLEKKVASLEEKAQLITTFDNRLTLLENKMGLLVLEKNLSLGGVLSGLETKVESMVDQMHAKSSPAKSSGDHNIQG